MGSELRWGIIGTGAIARRFAAELREASSGRLVSVGSRTAARADAFARDFNIERSYEDYQALIEDVEVDVVYIATPHPEHAQWAVRAAEAGKHILCEKPLTLHHADAEAVIEAARSHGVFLMEAFMYRCHPQTLRLTELLRDGAIGELRVIEAVHSFHGSDDPDGRLLSNRLGGGGILDVGCYCMSAARLVAGVATGMPSATEPIEVTGTAHIGDRSGVDEWAVASLLFPGNIVAHLACGIQVDQPPVLRLHGSEGSIDVSAPWLPGLDGARAHGIVVRRAGAPPATVSVETDRGLYAIEADEVAACIHRRASESSTVPWADSLGNMVALDRWRLAVGMIYDAERPAALGTPIHGRPLAVRGQPIPDGAIAGVGRPVSRLVLGTMLAHGDPSWPTAMSVFDEFFERGGNTFDSARRYGRGESDRALGHWMESRRVRPNTVVVAKGAHTPHCDPESLTRELLKSLDDLRTDYADLYFLHRDNLAVPAGEFVDVLNEHHRAGRIQAFGGSNWTMARIDEANRYANAHRLVGFTALSNQFSLARMISPTVPGCVAASGPAWRDWLEQTGMPVVAWSSQAAGFFAGVTLPRMRHAWHDPDNFARRDRTRRLGALLDCGPATVALAWVLRQPLAIFPIIGPHNLEELRTSLDAVNLDLSQTHLDWLDLKLPDDAVR